MVYYHTLPESEIRRRIFSVLDQDEYGNTIFHLSDQKRCPFLNSANLCDMHIAIGGEHTPFTCRTFPRFINDFGALREMGLSLICPVAAEMMFDPKYDFSFTEEMNDPPPTLNDIDARLYFTLLSARKTAYALVQDSTKPLARCLAELLDFAEELQGQIGALPTVTEKMNFRSVFQNPELINPQWPEKVAAGDLTAPVGESHFGRQIAMYFLFRYFLNLGLEGDVLSAAKMAVVGVLVPTYFGTRAAGVMHLWSKETEHSDVEYGALSPPASHRRLLVRSSPEILVRYIKIKQQRTCKLCRCAAIIIVWVVFPFAIFFNIPAFIQVVVLIANDVVVVAFLPQAAAQFSADLSLKLPNDRRGGNLPPALRDRAEALTRSGDGWA